MSISSRGRHGHCGLPSVCVGDGVVWNVCDAEVMCLLIH